MKEERRKLARLNELLASVSWRLHHDPKTDFLRRVSDLSEGLRLKAATDPKVESSLLELAFEAHIARLIKLNSISLVIDVGANAGQFAAIVRASEYDGLMVSFEPNEEMFGILEQVHPASRKQKNINGLVGSTSGTVDFPLSQDSLFSSLHKTSELGSKLYGDYMQTLRYKETRIDLLDQWLIQAGVEIPSKGILLKTDTQGHDLEVLKGAENLLSRTDVVLVEYPLESIYENAVKGCDVERYLRENGFKPSAFYPISRIGDSEALLELDAVFVRE